MKDSRQQDIAAWWANWMAWEAVNDENADAKRRSSLELISQVASRPCNSLAEAIARLEIVLMTMTGLSVKDEASSPKDRLFLTTVIYLKRFVRSS